MDKTTDTSAFGPSAVLKTSSANRLNEIGPATRLDCTTTVRNIVV